FEGIAGISAAIAGWGATLNHEIRNHAMEDSSIVKRRVVLRDVAHRGIPIFGTSRQTNEVCYRLRRLLFKQRATHLACCRVDYRHWIATGCSRRRRLLGCGGPLMRRGLSR